MFMPSRKERCQNWKLYAITDPAGLENRSLVEVVRAAIEGGADVIQLRDKTATDEQMIGQARQLLEMTRPAGIPLIINDRPEVAQKAGADGVHLGQEDLDLESARRLLGEGALIGRSTHSREQALRAQAEGFDYIGVGPVFQTPTKPSYEPVGLDLVRFVSQNIRVPFVAIGGIDEANVGRGSGAGARTVAVVRALMRAEDPKEAARNILKKMERGDEK